MTDNINQQKQKILFYFEKKQFKKAKKYILSILNKYEETLDILDMLAYSLLKQDKFEESIKIYLKLIRNYDKSALQTPKTHALRRRVKFSK